MTSSTGTLVCRYRWDDRPAEQLKKEWLAGTDAYRRG
jgi:hypothetical protein